jgi:hypothetical protein
MKATESPGPTLAPRASARAPELEGEHAVGLTDAGELRRRELLARDRLERRREVREIRLGDGETRGVRVAAEARDDAGRALRDEVERIPQMEAGDRAAGPLELVPAAARKHDRRPVILVLEARRDDPHDALVPFRAEQAQRERARRVGAGGDVGESLLLHRRLDVAPLAVQLVELDRKRQRGDLAVREQATDADGHVGEAACRTNRGPATVQVVRRRAAGIAVRGRIAQRSWPVASGANASPAQQRAVDRVEADNIRNGSSATRSSNAQDSAPHRARTRRVRAGARGSP